MSPVDFLEFLEAPRLAVEKLEHRHAREVLLKISVDAGDGDANLAVGLAHRLAKRHRGEDDQGQHRKGQQRQLPVHLEHHDDDADERKEVLKDGRHARREQVVEHVHVRGDARDQAAHRVAVEEAHLQPLQVAEDLLPEVVHHLLPHELHGERLPEFQEEGR